MRLIGTILAAALPLSAAMAPAAEAAPKDEVKHAARTVGGIAVDTYSWFDSNGLFRTVSLKRQGGGNTGNGGYAVAMTYQVVEGGKKRTVQVTADDKAGDGGFGYFVSHENYRSFADGSSATIAGKIFGADDSALGRGFPVTGRFRAGPQARFYIHEFKQTYYRYGTVAAVPKGPDGDDATKLPLTRAAFKKYDLPVTIAWTFEAGTDFPRIEITVDMTEIPGPDRVNFDVRGPYGVLAFDNGRDGVVAKAMWGDRFHFDMPTTPATRNSSWTWNTPNAGGRYGALVAGGYEMGLYEPLPFASSALAHGYANARGRASASYNGGVGCNDGTPQRLPCDWEWPYQSLQYSLPYDDVDAPTTGKKIAWGSAAFYGVGPSLPYVYDTGTTRQPFVGWPASRTLRYGVCVVLGATTANGLTKTAAATPKKRGQCAARRTF